MKRLSSVISHHIENQKIFEDFFISFLDILHMILDFGEAISKKIERYYFNLLK